MRTTRIPIGLFVALLALTSCDRKTPQEPAPPGSFELAYELNGDILIFDDATGDTRLVRSEGWSERPAWSPDGKRIAFARYADLDGIYVMNPNGTGVRQVTGAGYTSPSWSPQGDALAFWGSCPGDQICSAIYVQELSEGSVMRLVATSGFEPAWSPDGRRIAFVGHGPNAGMNSHSLRLVNADGSGLTEITPATSLYMSHPTWSPDGTRIAFSINGDIYVVRADGTGQTRLTTYETASSPAWYATSLYPAWSPDGTRIAYGTMGCAVDETRPTPHPACGSIMEISAEGGTPKRMTSGGGPPSWRP